MMINAIFGGLFVAAVVTLWPFIRSAINSWRYQQRCKKYPIAVLKKRRRRSQNAVLKELQDIRSTILSSNFLPSSLKQFFVRVGNNAGPFISSCLASIWLWLTNRGLLFVEGTIDTVRNAVDRALSSSPSSSKQSPARDRAEENEFETTTTTTTSQQQHGGHIGGINVGTATPTVVVNDLREEFDGYQPQLQPPSSLRNQPGYRVLNRSLNVTFEKQATNTTANPNNNNIVRETTGQQFSTPVSRYKQNEASYPQNGSGSILRKGPADNHNEGTLLQQHHHSVPRRQSTPHPSAVARKRQLEKSSENDQLDHASANIATTTENHRTPKYRKTLDERRDTPRYVRLSPSRNAADIDTKTSFSLQLRKRRMEDSNAAEPKQICESSSNQLSHVETEQTPSKRRRLNIGGRVSLHGSRSKAGVGIIGSPRGSTNGGVGLSRLAVAASHARRNGFLSTTSRNTFTQSSWSSSSLSTSRMGQIAKQERQERDRQLWKQLNQVEEKKAKASARAQSETAAPGSVPNMHKPTNEGPSSSGAPGPAASTPTQSTAPPAFSFGANTGAAGGQNISGNTSQTNGEINPTKPFSFGGQSSNDITTSKPPTSSFPQSTATHKQSENNRTKGPTFGSSGAGTDSASVPISSSSFTKVGAQPTAPVFGSTPSAANPHPGQAQSTAQAHAPTFDIKNPSEQPKAPGGFQNVFGASSTPGSAPPPSNQNKFSASGFNNTAATSTQPVQNAGTPAVGSSAPANPFSVTAQGATGTDVPNTTNPFSGNSTASDVPKFGQSANGAPPSGRKTPDSFAKSSAQPNSSVAPAAMPNGLGGGFNGTNQVNGVVNGAANFGSSQLSGSASGMKPFSAITGTENNPFAAAAAAGGNQIPTMSQTGFSVGGAAGGAGARRRQRAARGGRRR